MNRSRKRPKAEPPSVAPPSPCPPPANTEALGASGRGITHWTRAHRQELLLVAGVCFVLAAFSGSRFLRQSAAPHFIYQGQAWLGGRSDLDRDVLPNLEDWACVRNDKDKRRCVPPPEATDRWYVSFPPGPALVMLPFVALHGYQFNDTSFTVFAGALAILLAFRFLQRLSGLGDSPRSGVENLALALILGFGTIFFYSAIRGEVWFTAEILGVIFTFLYAGAALRAQKPVQAGIFYALATLSRTPLAFSGIFFLLECVAPGGGGTRREQLMALRQDPWSALRKLCLFVVGAAPLALLAAGYNLLRFGHLTEFGHSFLYNNRVNADIDQYGLFNLVYLQRNIEAAFLMLPQIHLNPLRFDYDPHGLSLFLTLPWLVLLFFPRGKSRLQLPLWVTVAFCALPGLLYQNTGYMQFGFRFSLDYTPYLVALLAVSGWTFRSALLRASVALGVLVNFWGAVAFRGYTELTRGF
jgi:hypothetical protein